MGATVDKDVLLADLIKAALLRISATNPSGTFQNKIDETAKMIIYDLKAHNLLR